MSTPKAIPIRASETQTEGYTLPAWIYENAEFLDLEREHIFAGSWQIVCHVCDLPNPGDYQTLDLLGDRVFAMRQFLQWADLCGASG